MDRAPRTAPDRRAVAGPRKFRHLLGVGTLVTLAAAVAAPCSAQTYADRADVRAFATEMVERHGFRLGELERVFAGARYLDSVVTLMTPAPAAQRSWQTYRANFLNPGRVEAGAAFWRRHAAVLDRATTVYGVPPEIVVAIIGVETEYGRNTGSFRVLDALATLAFDYPRRAEFFRTELEQFLLLARESRADAASFRGSYAGAIGIPQFMPGSIRRYAVDFDGDGRLDLRGSAADAIGSVANFLHRHGWRPGEAVQLHVKATAGDAWRAYADGNVTPSHPVAELVKSGLEAEVPPEAAAARASVVDLDGDLRLGLHNFYVITRYNRSALYAAAVADLAEALKAGQSAGR